MHDDPHPQTHPAPAAPHGVVPPAADAAPAALRPWNAVATVAAVAVVLGILNAATLPAWSVAYWLPLLLVAMGAGTAWRWWRAGVRVEARRSATAKVAEFGGGVYGTVAFATWLYLEASGLVEDAVAAGGLMPFVESMNIASMVSQAIQVGLTAMFWPWYWFDAYGFQTALWIAAGVWAFDGVAGALLPRLARWRARSVPAVLAPAGSLAPAEENP